LKAEKIKSWSLCFLAFAASAILLTVIQEPLSLSFLAWVAWVPFILICRPGAKLISLLICAFIVGSVHWLGKLYYICPITMAGWITFCLYTGLLWPLAAWFIRYCRSRKVPLFLAVAIVFVFIERMQGFPMGGFYWNFLAHSQYKNLMLIQIADVFGASGISFLVAMVNGLFAELIIAAKENKLLKPDCIIKTSVVGLAIAITLIYGCWQLNNSGEFIKDGPLVSAVQSNVPLSVKAEGKADTDILIDLLADSAGAIAAGAEFVVWPETMVASVLDENILKEVSTNHQFNIFDKMLKRHSKDKTHLLVGAYGGEINTDPNSTLLLGKRHNSAFLYRPDGTKSEKRYDKIHLVPFGEYVPFKENLPWLYKFLMSFSPYSYDYNLDAGKNYTVFEMQKGGRVYKFGVLICYEDVVPKIAQIFSLDESGNKQIDWLVNISNDGWFVNFSNGEVKPSSELAQHMAVCVFRAVENRVSIIRSVNTGVSCLINSTGQIKNSFKNGSLPKRAIERQGMAGWFVDNIQIDSRVSIFSKYGNQLRLIWRMSLFLVLIWLILGRFKKHKTS